MNMKTCLCLSGLVWFAFFSCVRAEAPTYWSWAPTPPMGWNSYDAFGDSVTEAEVMTNATYLKEKLLAHGWNYVVVDYRWYDPGAHDNKANNRKDVELTMDANGRLLPSPNRFPSAVDGKGFKPLADKIHGMGLKFGIHVMRGIPRRAVTAGMPIEGSTFKAADAANSKSTCSWCPDMWGVDASKPAGQAYYDSIFRLYASWGLDFVKVDDLSSPYSTGEIEAIRHAIDKCGRPIVFSTSPGETPLAKADHIKSHANMWRVSGDFWDNWNSLNHAFELAEKWQKCGGPGHWPDFDMIPFGHIGIRSEGGGRQTKFSKDEQMMLMTLWCLAPSPLMLGMNMPDNDEGTLSLLTNDEVLAVNQDALGKPASFIVKYGSGGEIWLRELKDGSRAAGIFNRGSGETKVFLRWMDAGLSGKQSVRDLWRKKDLGTFENEFSVSVPAHGAVMLQLKALGK